MVKEVVWPLSAQEQLEESYNYIREQSYQNAEKVKNEILTSTRLLPKNPEQHPLGKYRKNNDGSFRAYELYHYRIAYQITERQIIIVRVRHTSREPLQY